MHNNSEYFHIIKLYDKIVSINSVSKESIQNMFIILSTTLSDDQKDSLEKLFNTHHGNFLCIAKRILRSDAKAEDAVSNSYIKIIENVDKIFQLSCPEMAAYCVTIVKNTSFDILRSESKVDAYADTDASITAEDSAEQTVLLNIETETLLKILSKLSREDQLILQMKYIKQYSYPKIAEVLSLPEETVKKRGQRALKKLRGLYEQENG